VSLWDDLKDVGKRALVDTAKALEPKAGEETSSPLENMARVGVAGLARGIAEEIDAVHCEARTRVSMGQTDLRCGKPATHVVPSAKPRFYCGDCAPKNAVPITVDG
jgi:hypothetical protein